MVFFEDIGNDDDDDDDVDKCDCTTSLNDDKSPITHTNWQTNKQREKNEKTSK